MWLTVLDDITLGNGAKAEKNSYGLFVKNIYGVNISAEFFSKKFMEIE